MMVNKNYFKLVKFYRLKSVKLMTSGQMDKAKLTSLIPPCEKSVTRTKIKKGNFSRRQIQNNTEFVDK